LNEPQMAPIGTDQRTKEGKKSVCICAICGLKQTSLSEECLCWLRDGKDGVERKSRFAKCV